MNTNILKIKAIVLFLIVSAFSCEKEDMEKYVPDCKTGSCVNANIKGSLRINPTGEGLRNVPVEVYFSDSPKVPLFPTERKVASGKTNKNGEFDFKVTIDTKSFENFHLIVKIPEQKNYITASENFRKFDSYCENALKNINFRFYKKASLTINFKRTQTDVFDDFSGDYRYDNNHRILLSPKYATNGILQIETAADVYTIIQMWKYLNHEITFEFVDSLICKRNDNNVININY